MSQLKVCPHCGHDVIAAKIVRGAQLRFTGEQLPEIVSETQGFNFTLANCCECKQALTSENLVDGVVCPECSKATLASNISPDGVCTVCEASKLRPELMNMTQLDLIKMIISLEKNAGKKTEKIEKKVAAAEEVLNPTEEPKKAAKPKANKKEEVQSEDIIAEMQEAINATMEAVTEEQLTIVDPFAIKTPTPDPIPKVDMSMMPYPIPEEQPF